MRRVPLGSRFNTSCEGFLIIPIRRTRPIHPPDCLPIQKTDSYFQILESYLYVEQKYRVPGGWREAYSPYRTYFHNVVAQRVGIPATLAALYIGCVERLKLKGALQVDVDVMIVPKAKGASGAFGVTQPKAPWGRVRGDVDDKNPKNRGAVVCTPKMSVTLQLQALKRAFWPWEWDDSRDSGVLLAVEALDLELVCLPQLFSAEGQLLRFAQRRPKRAVLFLERVDRDRERGGEGGL